jgi:hypothetical protein
MLGEEETLSKAQERLQVIATAPYLAGLLCLDNNQMKQLLYISNINFEPKKIKEQNQFSEKILNHDLSVLQLSHVGNVELLRATVSETSS